MTTVHEFEARTIDGRPASLGDFEGKTLMIVNVASKCGLTPQYARLQTLYEKYRDRGFAVLGFPCNQFMGQEPGEENEIKQFCTSRYGVSFPLFAKIEVNGPGAHPLYAFLRAAPTQPTGAGDISWNFEKFLIGKDGTVKARFSPPTAPDAPEVIAAIEREL